MSRSLQTEPSAALQESIEALAGMDIASAEAFLRANPDLIAKDVVLRITEKIPQLALENTERARHLSQIAEWLAEQLNDDFCRARTLRAIGHLFSRTGHQQEAVDSYANAVALFQKMDERMEMAITLSSSLQALMYVGRYDQAFSNAEEAREILKSHGDKLRLARLDVNLGNILTRQDRFNEALVLYRRAEPVLESFQAYQDLAIVLMNIAVCSTGLFDFSSAVAAYSRAREFSSNQNLPLLTAQADYNIAYLYYLRGDFARAIHLYRDSRAFCAAAGDSFHGALCDLDQAEMYLDLNLSDEAEKLAWQAHGSFQQLGLGYEAAKSVAFLAMAAMQKNNFGQALELLETAQKSFVEQRNAVWPALLDIYRALSYLREGRLCEARRNTDLALTFFSHSHMPGKAIIAQLVRATLHLKTGQPMEARYWVDAARNAVEKTGTQSRHYLCEYVSGTVLEAIGSISEAHTCYQNSRAALEDLAAWHPSEELKVPFLEDKSVIYQAIFATRACTTNEVEEESGNDRAAFDLVQKAKTWGVVHGPTFRAPVRVAPENTRSAIAHRVVALREEMNWLHRRITVEELRPERTPESLEALRLKAREHESILMKTLDGLKASGEEQIGPHVAPTVSLENLRHVLPANATFLEYFEIRGVLHVCVASHKSMRIIPLTPSARAKRLVESLRARFARFERKETFHELRGHSEATVDLLKTLHGDLVAPARMLLHGDRLIIAPHQFLHGLPFHALHDGARYLIDDFSVSYAMSASTFFLSRHKTSCEPPRSLILDVLNPDGLSNIAEVSAVVSALPNPEVLSVNGGTIARAVESASHYNVVHIVQPPLRSTCAARSPDLEQGQVAAVDCSQIEWDCDLLTLGNPARAGSSADGGAELVRKASRSVQAGAGAVLMSLWNIPDPLRVSLLRDFYSLYSASGDKERSLQQAIIKLRGECPQSFGWASFILMGTAD